MQSGNRLPVRLIFAVVFLFSVLEGPNVYFSRIYLYVEAVYTVVVIVFVLFFLREVFFRRYLPKAVEWFLLAILLIPVYSALRSYLVFDQPLLYGILADRRWLKAGGIIFLIFLYRKQYLKRDDVKIALLTVGVAAILTYWFICLAVDPEPLHNGGFVLWGGLNKWYVFRLSPYPVIFVSFYFAFSWIRSKGVWNLVPAILAMDYVLFMSKARFLSAAYLFSFFLILFAAGYVRRHAARVVMVFTLVAVSYFALHALFPKRIYSPMSEYGRLVYSVEQYVQGAGLARSDYALRDQEGVRYSPLDRSTGLRLLEMKKAVDRLNESAGLWLMGLGRLSTRWQGGFQSGMGYFYVSDIGILGAVFLYGIPGLVFLLIQFPMGLRCGWKQKDSVSGPYPHSVLSFWILTGLLCMGDGHLVTFPGIWMVAFGLLMMTCMSTATGDSVFGKEQE